jgi:hypothetical protein
MPSSEDVIVDTMVADMFTIVYPFTSLTDDLITGNELFVLMMGRLFSMVAFVVAGLFNINLKIIGHIG